MRADGLVNGTVNSRLAMARAHLRHAADADPSLTSAWLASRKVPTPPAPKGWRPVTVVGDLPAFLDAPERTRLGNRDRLDPPPAVRHGDERAAEPVGATLGDLVVPSGAPAPVPARGKGRRERCIGPSDRADARLRAYLDACHGEERDPSTPLSYTVVHGVMHAMSERNVERIVAKYGDVAREEHSGI